MLLLPADLIAVVTLHEVLNMIFQHPDLIFVKIALKIGRALHQEFQLYHAKSESQQLRKVWVSVIFQ